MAAAEIDINQSCAWTKSVLKKNRGLDLRQKVDEMLAGFGLTALTTGIAKRRRLSAKISG